MRSPLAHSDPRPARPSPSTAFRSTAFRPTALRSAATHGARRTSGAHLAATLAAAIALVGSPAGANAASSTASAAGASRQLTIVATTPILADVTAAIAGDHATVTSAMPRGVDPHAFELSLADAAALQDADLVIANGLGLEHGMAATLAALDGVPLLEVAQLAIDPTLTGAHDDHDHADADHADDGHDADADADHADDGHDHGDGADGHAHEGDPHFWTDPTRMIVVVAAIGTELAELAPEYADELAANTAAYVAELEALDTEISAQITAIPHDDRHAITSHAMLGYFAARYDIHIEATIVGASSQASPSLGELAELVDLLDAEGIEVIFVSATERTDVADSLAAEAAGDVAVVPIEVESLGPDGSPTATYVGMLRTLATTVATALNA